MLRACMVISTSSCAACAASHASEMVYTLGCRSSACRMARGSPQPRMSLSQPFVPLCSRARRTSNEADGSNAYASRNAVLHMRE
jgi:hypothetical protein